MNTDRRRQAFMQSRAQQRTALARLADDGLHPLTLPELVDDLAELVPPVMYG